MKHFGNTTNMEKKSHDWISFDFASDSTVKSRKRCAGNSRKQPTGNSIENACKSISAINFQRALEPNSVSELAVHPKKIQEVESWLDFAVKNRSKSSTFLVISGPTGAGKTITLKVLCKKLNLSLREWSNPIDENFEIGKTMNQVQKFKEFLLESKYQSLFAQPGKSAVLIEDFPNIFLRNPEEFQTVIEDCYHKCSSIIVFICNESFDKGNNISQTLFPADLRDRYKIHNISFNACANTIMKTALNRALNFVQSHKDRFQIPSSNAIEAILATSMGDIRCAINQFFFASLLGSCDLPTTILVNNEPQSAVKGRKKKPEKTVKQMSRDERLGLFHGLGRVLNPKRSQVNNISKLNCDFDKLIDEFSIQPNSFVAFLFENYLKYFGEITDVYSASEYLSLAEIFLDKWIDRSDVFIYALWISVMGLMLANEHKVSKWNQISGPKKILAKKNIDSATMSLSPTDLYYYHYINKSPSECFFRGVEQSTVI